MRKKNKKKGKLKIKGYKNTTTPLMDKTTYPEREVKIFGHTLVIPEIEIDTKKQDYLILMDEKTGKVKRVKKTKVKFGKAKPKRKKKTKMI